MLRGHAKRIVILACVFQLASVVLAAKGDETPSKDRGLEEIIVTAQKREEKLQEIPIAISVLTEKQLTSQGVKSLSDLTAGTLTSLNVLPYANTPSALVITIRGNGPGDVGHSTRDASVAIYIDDDEWVTSWK